MFRSSLLVLAVVCSACGSLGPPKPDGGTGGGGSLFGGGTGGSGGGTGGGLTGGGTGGGTTGGGTGGGGTGGGATGGGGGGVLASLSWASISLIGATSSSNVVGISGSATDLWAAQQSGPLFRSTGAAFNLVTTMTNGAKALYAKDGTVVVVQPRSLRSCKTTCASDADFADFSLLGGAFNLTGEAVCGRAADDITAIVSDTGNMAQVFHWNGTAWTRTSANLGVAYPRACWFDDTGALFVVGADRVARSESGATTIETLSSNLTNYFGGVDVGGTSWVVGPNHFVARRSGTTWTPFTVATSSSLYAVGGPSANEVYALGFFATTIGNGFKWNGTALTPLGANTLPNTGQGSQIRTMAVTGPNEIYLGGSNAAGPIIIRGRR